MFKNVLKHVYTKKFIKLFTILFKDPYLTTSKLKSRRFLFRKTTNCCHVYLCNKIRKGKGKSLDQNIYFKKEQTLNILDSIADEMTCPISNEPEDKLCILKCQHVISLNNLKKLKQEKCSKCPKCREIIEDNNNHKILFIKIYIHIFLMLDIFYRQMN